MSYLALATIVFVLIQFLLVLMVRRILRKGVVPSARKGLFRFNDGKRINSIDPISTLLALEGHKELLLYRHPDQARNGNRDAIRICVDAVQSCFGVQQYTQPNLPGLTVTEMLNLLDAFICYCDLQKKSTKQSETLPPSSEPTSSEFTEPTIPSSLDSGSIAIAQ